MSRRFLVDTDILINFLRGRAIAARFVNEHVDRIIESAISVAGLYGAVRDGAHDAERQDLADCLDLIPVVPVSAGIAKAGGLYRRDYGRSHGVGLADAVIAATADSTDAALKTLNFRHYPMFTGVEPAYRK